MFICPLEGSLYQTTANPLTTSPQLQCVCARVCGGGGFGGSSRLLMLFVGDDFSDNAALLRKPVVTRGPSRRFYTHTHTNTHW